MHEREFESSLERMFRETPAMPDAELFAAQVERRLNRGWAMRRWGVGAAGVIGGSVAVTQTLGANLTLRIDQASTRSVEAVDTVYRQALGQAEQLSAAGGTLGAAAGFGDLGLGMFWVISGVIVLAAAAMFTRVFDEI